mgnify:CR=1 FL=1
MAFDVYIMYAYIGVVCAFILGIVLNRTRATAFKNIIDKKLCSVFIFFIVFCFFDAFWGIVGSRMAKVPYLYEISSYAFHLLAALSSIFISWYSAQYFGFKDKTAKILTLLRCIVFLGQISLIVQNFWTKNYFTIDADGIYHAGNLRRVGFYLQYLQYFPYAIYALIISFKNFSTKKIRNKHLLGAFFLVIPVVFGILQMLYPDGAFYSLGFAVFSVAIYSIAVTAQREEFLADYNRVETQKKSQKSIEIALNAAKEANNVKSKFLANMSHDIRTPINGIMGMVKLAQEEKNPQKIQYYLEKIDGTSKHLLSLVNDVLDMTLIDNKQGALLNEEPANIYTIIDNCNSIISGQIIDKNIYFHINFVNEITEPNIIVDQLRLRQIFINVLGNAIKFTKDGGVDFIIEQTKTYSGMVEYKFVIKDTGIGMSKEFMNKIFDPFQQENGGSGRTQYQGTGLGMSITKQLVDFMKGTIVVESEQYKGSCFTITIPFKISEKTIVVPKDENYEQTIKGLKILLAEDNELNMEIAKIAEAERLKRAEEEKKAEELRRARALVREDDAKKAAEAKAAAVDEPKKKKHTGLKVFGVIILLLIIFAGVCVASGSFTSNPVYGTPTLSYISNYNVWLPQGTTTVAGQQVTVLGAADQMMITLPGMPAQRISQGETVRTNPATMSVSLLWGAWKVMDITYAASFKYMGVTTDGLVTFHTSIATDKQIPEFLLNVVLSMAGIKYQKA